MTKFIFKSNASDLQKISQSLVTIQKNVLYLTYRMDTLLKNTKEYMVDKGLQKQVTDFYDESDTTGSDDMRTNMPEESQDLD